MSRKIALDRPLLQENIHHAGRIRALLERHRVTAFNLVSSPGSGKTSLLERTLKALAGKLNMALIAGDVSTQNDADRLKAAGGQWVRPLETGGTCHLEAAMLSGTVAQLDLPATDILFIENVGNLVCPAAYDLGEHEKIVLISTVEGDDKPLKYPVMFRNASVMVINKIDLLGLTEFSLATVKENAFLINPDLRVFELSCRTGEGLSAWFDWLQQRVARVRGTESGHG